MRNRLFGLIAATLLSAAASKTFAADVTLLNVSYDPTREFYKEYNQAFAKYWKGKAGDNVTVNQSHGGGGKQARAVLDGLEADVVTLAISADIDQLARRNLIPENWQSQLPNNSAPYTSTIVFVVRKGNPQHVKDWSDLIKPGLSVVTPNPKTSGGARWNYMAAWAYALKHNNNSEEAAKDFVGKLFKNTSVLDTGARGSTTTFAERDIGDVLITWENEAYLVLKEFGADKYEVVTPSFSILAEPPVTVVEDVARKHGTTEVATEYLKYLYGKEGQEIIAKNFYRPIDKEVAAKYAKQFPALELVSIAQLGGWPENQAKHFADDGIFDKIYGR
ncbi:sulfate ABC transporter substrate-binding protein [Methylomonas sp. MED-D]|uniref:sulfate ABC transporter substrate-binding protein n=1 Tax=unclassified Methylomonas TaxID=2608980 RepID=UPI0028A570C1|nr:sulfate ABC transporter substrate-binding protein [Methylomonas sp. MV1]MDT4331663.1 sulfate ABC transporter substrate-binding protein [Methylomonas sp. MV1]